MTSQKAYTIKDVAYISGMPASTLRYYEGIGIIPTIERDASSKQRVYTQENVDMIDAISCLHATGLSIEDMKSYIHNLSRGKAGAQNEIELLRSQAVKLEEESQYLELRKQYVALKIQYWKAVQEDDETRRRAIANEAKKLASSLKKIF